MKRIIRELNKTEIGLSIVAFMFIVLQVWLDLKLPDYMGEITQLVQTPNSEMNDIIVAGAFMLLCALGSMISAIIVAIIAAKVGTGFAARLRETTFNKIQNFSMEELNHFSTASLITRSTNDITQIQMLIVMGLQVIIKAPILGIWSMMKISGKSWQWTTATGVAVVALVLMLGGLLILVFPKFTKLQTLTDKLNLVAREHLTGVNVVRAYNAENYQEDKFELANNDLTKTNLFTNRAMAILNPGITIIMSMLSLSIYWIGAILIEATDLMSKINLFSDMVVFSSYAMQLLMAFMLLVMIFIIFPRANVSAKRVGEVLDCPVTIIDGTFEGESNEKGTIEFKNVSFKYPNAKEYVLKDINFKANKGETIAFIGSTGSGKSTIINLIPRFYDATEGQILVDGKDVKEYRLKSLRDKLGYVTQKATLFSGTINSNISLGEVNGKKPTKSDVVDAVFLAQGSEFVEKQKDTYDGEVAQGGTNFSGGQKQRLSIARAIARRAEVLIFDDSFSALDYKTDRILRTELKKHTAGTTLLIVAQRIGTIKDADKIVVLDEGKIAGMGTHEYLLDNCEVYQEIAYSQLSKEELENGRK